VCGDVKAGEEENPLRNPTVNLGSQSHCPAFQAEVEAELGALRSAELYRCLRTVEGLPGPRMRVDGQDVLMLAGANYLDLAGDPRVIAGAQQAMESAGCAAGGSRLITGNLALHEALEHDLATFVGAEAVLIFSTGYMANLGVITTLAGPGDVIISDALNHASIIDACHLSRASTRVFRHNDLEDLARVAASCGGFRRRVLVLDGVYSMDGDVARLREMAPIAAAYNMVIVLDDAHGLGILGPGGRGVASQEGVVVDIQIGNLGKALGSFGAYVACSHTLRELLINRTRSLIFTCGLAPAPLGAAHAALRIIQDEPWRRLRLLERAEQLRAGLKAAGFDTGASTTHIVPAIVGDNRATMSLCERALALGVHAQGIRYPSVPEGTARIRFTPMCSHSPDDIQHVVKIFSELGC
jgi:8-amino-7-oxononanoate synthase